MKCLFTLSFLPVILAALLFTGITAEAQDFGFSVTSSASSILVSNSLTYTINVTNLTSSLLSQVFVTNSLPSSVQIYNTNPDLGTVSVNGSLVVFNLGAFASGEISQLGLTVEPTAVGFMTNMVTVATPDLTNTVSTNVVTQVTNAVILADLAVAITPPAEAVITNDLTAYDVSVTNLGPDAAPNVILTNTLPPDVLLKGVSAKTYTTVGSNLIFNLGTLKNGGYTNIQFSIQPTNLEVLPLIASVGAAGVTDANLTNNSASTNLTVMTYQTGMLDAFTNSAQNTNFMNGLLEQAITVTNIGTNAVFSVRVVVTGLTNQLFNAVGTNNGNPFVIYSATLHTNQSVNLLLQYFPRKSFPFTNSQLQAFGVPVPNLSPPPVSSISTNLVITRIVPLPNGDMLIEFPSVLGRTYTVVYSDNVSFSNAMIAPPSIVAPANDTEWIDYGPPTTVSSPTNANVRFYRVIQNP